MADLHAKFRDCPTAVLPIASLMEHEPAEPPARPVRDWPGKGAPSRRAAICPGCGSSRSLYDSGDSHLVWRGHEHEWGTPCSTSGRPLCQVPAATPGRVRPTPCTCEAA